MKIIINKIWLLAAMFTFSACGSDETIVGQEEPEKELKEYTVSLKLGGEITTSESPLARAETASDDLYGIEVTYYNKDNNQCVFAYGLFDNVNDVKVNLLKSITTYQIQVLLVKNGKNLIYSDDGNYAKPFGSYYGPSSLMNEFKYAQGSTVNYHSFGYLTKGEMKITDQESIKYPEARFYYGQVNNYTPSVNGTVEIDLKHTVFGLKYEVSGITDGTVSVSISNDTRAFFSKSDIAEDYTSEEKIFSFYDVYNAWQYADNYTENLSVGVSWTRGIGVLQPLGSTTIQVKRNVMNVVRIQLGSNDGSATFGITTEDDASMGTASVDIPLN